MDKENKLELGSLLDQLQILCVVKDKNKNIYNGIYLSKGNTHKHFTINLSELESLLYKPKPYPMREFLMPGM